MARDLESLARAWLASGKTVEDARDLTVSADLFSYIVRHEKRIRRALEEERKRARQKWWDR